MAETASNSNGSQIGVVAETYARALYDAAKGNRELTSVREEIAELATMLAEDARFGALFDNRTIDAGRRARSIRRIFEGTASGTLINFLLVLNDKQRLDEVAGIAVAFDRIDKAERDQVDVEVFTAVRLSREQLDNVAERVGDAIGKKAIVSQQVDESLIGGLKLRIGDKLIDASVASQLRRMARRIVAGGRDTLRADSAIEA